MGWILPSLLLHAVPGSMCVNRVARGSECVHACMGSRPREHMYTHVHRIIAYGLPQLMLEIVKCLFKLHFLSALGDVTKFCPF